MAIAILENENALLFKGGWGGSDTIKKATIPQKTILCINRLQIINVMLYSVSMLSLKAPLFKGGWGDQ
jgi:hypothetical protein